MPKTPKQQRERVARLEVMEWAEGPDGQPRLVVKRHSRLAHSDKRVQSVMKYLWGTWGVDDVRRKIARRFPQATRRAVAKATKGVIRLHCEQGTYDCDDIACQLDRCV